jgi:hypothetical protein
LTSRRGLRPAPLFKPAHICARLNDFMGLSPPLRNFFRVFAPREKPSSEAPRIALGLGAKVRHFLITEMIPQDFYFVKRFVCLRWNIVVQTMACSHFLIYWLRVFRGETGSRFLARRAAAKRVDLRRAARPPCHPDAE